MCYQLPDGILYDFQPIADDALGVILHQILAALTRFQLHSQTIDGGHHGNKDESQHERRGQKVHLQDVLLGGFVLGGPAHRRPSQIFCEFWNNL